MDITQQQEQFSNSYLGIIATLAECTLAKPQVDDDSIDYNLKGKGYSGQFSRPQLDIQLKCYRKSAINSSTFSYSLKLKNYNDLRVTDVLVPRLLVVLVVPKEQVDWLKQSDEQTVIKHCAYWVSVRGKPPTSNQSNVTVPISQSNRFTPDELRNLIQTVADGGAP